MVNPYLMAAGILKAIDDGIKHKLDPGKPEERNIYAAMEAGKQVKKLPMTLGDALEALKKDEVIKSAMPGEMYRLYDEYKRDEWETFLPPSTEWDLKTYLRLPAVELAQERSTHMCGIAGLIHRDGTGEHRPGDDRDAAVAEASRPDSTGYALYGEPRAQRVGACASRSPSRRT